MRKSLVRSAVSWLSLFLVISCSKSDEPEQAEFSTNSNAPDWGGFERFLDRPLVARWAVAGTQLHEALYWAPTKFELSQVPDNHFPAKFEVDLNDHDEGRFVYDHWRYVIRDDYTPKIQFIVTTGFMGIECFLSIDGDQLVGYGEVLSDVRGSAMQLPSVVVSLVSPE
jgi:hypothetical protein